MNWYRYFEIILVSWVASAAYERGGFLAGTAVAGLSALMFAAIDRRHDERS